MKFGIVLLFAIFTQIMIIIVSYEFVFYYAGSNGGIGHSSAIGTVNPFIWVMVVLELMIATGYLNLEWEKKKSEKR